MKPQFSTTLYGFTATATSEASGFPASRLGNYLTHPLLRTWRSAVTTQVDIVCDVGVGVTVRRVALMNVNFLNFQLARSTDNITYNDVTVDMVPTLDVSDNMYKSFNTFTDAARQYIRIRIPAQTPIDGASWFEIGALLLMPTLSTWPRDIIAPIRQGLVKITMQSGDQSLDTGDQYMTQEFDGIFSNQETNLLYTLSRHGKSNPIFWKEGIDNPERIYVARVGSDITYERHGFHHALSMNLRAWY